MFENYSHKTKFKALLIIGILLFVTAYKRSYSTLISLINENTILKDKDQMINKGVKDYARAKEEVMVIDRIIGNSKINKEGIQQEILSFVSSYDIVLADMKPVHEFTDELHRIFTYEIQITGDLNQLLQLSYDLEKEFTLSRVVSLQFYTIKQNNKNKSLLLKIIFQNYESI